MRTKYIIGVIVFVFVLGIHSVSPIMTSTDSRWAIHTAVSIVSKGTTDLDQWYDELRRDNSVGIRERDGHYYAFYPLGPPLVAIPAMLITFGVLQPPVETDPGVPDCQHISL